jgi:septal ring factor EnvC (AmiA/AmiB activator)
MNKALPSKPGSPAHNEATALKENVAALQTEVAELKENIAFQDIHRDGLEEQLKLQDDRETKLVAESRKQADELKAIRAELKSVKSRNTALVGERIQVDGKNIDLEATVAELQAEANALATFKRIHIQKGQPMLVDLMTMEYQADGMDEPKARRAAELRYVKKFGIPIAGSDDTDYAITEK